MADEQVAPWSEDAIDFQDAEKAIPLVEAPHDLDPLNVVGAAALRALAENMPWTLWTTYGGLKNEQADGVRKWILERADNYEKTGKIYG